MAVCVSHVASDFFFGCCSENQRLSRCSPTGCESSVRVDLVFEHQVMKCRVMENTKRVCLCFCVHDVI